MPFFRLRTIPKASKDVFERSTPHSVLLKALQSVDLTFPLKKQFVERRESNAPVSNPSGYEPPIGGTEHLPFHVSRTNSGSLPVYTDYR